MRLFASEKLLPTISIELLFSAIQPLVYFTYYLILVVIPSPDCCSYSSVLCHAVATALPLRTGLWVCPGDMRDGGGPILAGGLFAGIRLPAGNCSQCCGYLLPRPGQASHLQRLLPVLVANELFIALVVINVGDSVCHQYTSYSHKNKDNFPTMKYSLNSLYA